MPKKSLTLKLFYVYLHLQRSNVKNVGSKLGTYNVHKKQCTCIATKELQNEIHNLLYGDSICIKSSIFELRLMSRIKKERERNVHTHRTWMQWLTDNISDMYNDHNPIITKSI